MKTNRLFHILVILLSVLLLTPQLLYACTALRVKTTNGSTVYARTMEFDVELDSKVIVIPRAVGA